MKGNRQPRHFAAGSKLREDRGVTILLAMFLMLVCLAVGAVVLTAATASGGRLTDIAETDARFYSVDSAAKLIRSGIEGGSVTIVRKKTDTETRVYSFRQLASDGSIVYDEEPDVSNDTEYAMYLGDDEDAALADELESSILISAAAELFGLDYEDEDYAETAFALEQYPAMEEEQTHSYALSHDSEDLDVSALEVGIETVLGTGGNLTVTISSADEKYAVVQHYRLNLSESQNTRRTEDETPQIESEGTNDDGDGCYTETVVRGTATIRTTELYWSFYGSEVLRNAA